MEILAITRVAFHVIMVEIYVWTLKLIRFLLFRLQNRLIGVNISNVTYYTALICEMEIVPDEFIMWEGLCPSLKILIKRFSCLQYFLFISLVNGIYKLVLCSYTYTWRRCHVMFLITFFIIKIKLYMNGMMLIKGKSSFS